MIKTVKLPELSEGYVWKTKDNGRIVGIRFKNGLVTRDRMIKSGYGCIGEKMDGQIIENVSTYETGDGTYAEFLLRPKGLRRGKSKNP